MSTVDNTVTTVSSSGPVAAPASTAGSIPGPSAPAAVSLRGAAVRFGTRTLWSGLDLDIAPGEFVAVLGPNGSGKTTLVKVLLGLLPLAEGEVRIAGRTPRRGSPAIGYIPQQKAFEPDLPLRGRDLVGLGLDGHRWGTGGRGRAVRRAKVAAALAAVEGSAYADSPIGMLSGGEQQRLRIAQALVGEPEVLLCDEPLLSLDLAHQRVVTDLVDARRRAAGTAVLFVTHEINPVLPLVDRVLYLAGGRFRIGPVEEVMTSPVLSELFGTQVDVLQVRDRLVVIGADTASCHGDGPWTA